MFYLAEIFRTSDLGDSISSNPERSVPRRWWGGVRLYRNLQQGAGSPNIKDYCYLMKYLKLMNLALFYVWKIQESGLTEIILFICISATWGQHPAFFLHPWFLEVNGGSVIAVGPQVVFSFMVAPED